MSEPRYKLFYDGSCGLCQREIRHLRKRLVGQVALIDINQPGFYGWQGVSKEQMMQEIHLWNGQSFVKGLEATLVYWRLAGLGLIVALIRLPGVFWMANKAYRAWAAWRLQKSLRQSCPVRFK
ncbi:thiol-disulfide oxidoreductase DCC family protein [Nitrincola tapanii]|nr:DUF393 domain-containing protein [Nitrincola tapanii]